MKKSIQTTIRDCATALQKGVAESMLRWALISDGWKAKRADQIMAWARMHVQNSPGNPYPSTTSVMSVDPDSAS